MIRPIHILLFSCIVFAIVIAVSLVDKSTGFCKSAAHIRTPDFFHSHKPAIVYKDISRLVSLGDSLDNKDEVATVLPVQQDTMSKDSVTTQKCTTDISINQDGVYDTGVKFNDNQENPDVQQDSLSLVSIDSLKENHDSGIVRVPEKSDGSICKIDYPEGADTLLYPVFRALISLGDTKQLIHILHFGDSQIEGDRVSSYLRNQFQRHFGGAGMGMIPIVANGPASLPYTYEISDGWERYSAQDKVKKSDNNQYGIYLSYYKIKSSVVNGTDTFDGWINLKWPNTGNPLIARFTKCSMYFGNVTKPFCVELTQKDSVLNKKTISQSNAFDCISWTFKRSEKDLFIKLTGTESPDIYGVSLTCGSGISFDNIPLRGSSGLEFTSADKQFLRRVVKNLNVKMLILQFGVNVVPYVRSNYAFYEKSFSNQLSFLKSIDPDLQIIVLGVGDAAQQTENGIESYPNIEKIRDAQRNAAFANGCAFWDSYQAMGGKNSMYSWVHADPPLAQKDYTHLTRAGAQIIGELFFRAFIAEYNKFSTTGNGSDS
jgi:lysophospholipase L1-like esterase